MVTAPTPGQAAYEAYCRHVDRISPPPWEHLHSGYQDGWEQVAEAGRAALAAQERPAPVPRLRVGACPAHEGKRHVQLQSGDEWLCLRGLADLHEGALAAAQERPAPVAPLSMDCRAGNCRACIGPPGEQCAHSCHAPGDAKPAPELAAAMRETRLMRELLTEILATFGTPAKPGTVRWTARQVAGWRRRAGLEA